MAQKCPVGPWNNVLSGMPVSSLPPQLPSLLSLRGASACHGCGLINAQGGPSGCSWFSAHTPVLAWFAAPLYLCDTLSHCGHLHTCQWQDTWENRAAPPYCITLEGQVCTWGNHSGAVEDALPSWGQSGLRGQESSRDCGRKMEGAGTVSEEKGCLKKGTRGK